MRYTWLEKKKYFIGGLFVQQPWRLTVDEKNRKIVSNWLLFLSGSCMVFVSNRVMTIFGNVWTIDEFWSDAILLSILAGIGGVVYLIVKKYRNNLRLQFKLFILSLLALFTCIYSYVGTNKEKTIQRLRKAMRLSEH